MFRTIPFLRRLAGVWRSTPHRPARRLGLEALEDRSVPTLLGQQLFPADHAWNQRIVDAPVAANSQAILGNLTSRYGDGALHPDFSQNFGTHTSLYGIPYNVVRGNSVPKVHVVLDAYPDESDLLAVPLPAGVVLEGDYQDGPRVGVNNRGDSHLLLYDVDNQVAYEFYRMSRPSENADGRWHADQQTVWDMKTNTFRTLGHTSADAAGLSLLAGLARPDEALPVSQGGQGVINHAIRVTLQNSIILDRFVYPASHTANPGNTNASILPPMGARLRLKADVDISTLHPQSRVVAQAMKEYGLIVADNGSNFFFSGASSSVDASNQQVLTWDDDDIQDRIRGLKSLNFSDFEVVDLTPAVTGLSLTTAPAGSTLTVSGRNFSGAAGQLQVFFGAVAAPSVTLIDDGHLQVVVPPGAGSVDLRVQSGVSVVHPDNLNPTVFGYGLSPVTLAGRFSYGVTGDQPAAISSTAAASFTEGQAGSFTVRATGTPTPSLSILAGSLPEGLTFTDHGDGSATLAGSPADGSRGVVTLTLGAANGVGAAATQTFTLTVLAPAARTLRAVGSDAGIVATVIVTADNGVQTTLRPFGNLFRGGVRVATGDVNGDGSADLIVGAGPGTLPAVKVYSGSDYSLLRSFTAYAAAFRGGVQVASGDLIGLGVDQVVVSPGAGAAPVVKIYDLRDGVRLQRSLLAFAAGFTGGVTVGAADGVLAVGTASRYGVVRLFDGVGLSRLRAITPFGAAFAGGVTVDVGGGWLAVGRARGGSDVRVHDLSALGLTRTIVTRPTPPRAGTIGGSRVAWAQTAAGEWELITGTGPGWPALVQVWAAATWQQRSQSSVFGGWVGGVRVA